jgi:hypothetical protein
MNTVDDDHCSHLLEKSFSGSTWILNVWTARIVNIDQLQVLLKGLSCSENIKIGKHFNDKLIWIYYKCFSTTHLCDTSFVEGTNVVLKYTNIFHKIIKFDHLM